MVYKIEKASEKEKALYEAAMNARNHSYSPYSGYQVGASIRLSNGVIYSGCNIENSSYGATTCAERVAVQNAVSNEGQILIQEVMVITDASPPWPPCGICRQVLTEFGKQITVFLANTSGEVQKLSMSELFPQAFTPEYLGVKK